LKDLVDLVGIEPTTSSMPWKRAPSCATGPHIDNGESRRVTAFILAGKQGIVKRAQAIERLVGSFAFTKVAPACVSGDSAVPFHSFFCHN
jgi:hypothetical protein